MANLQSVDRALTWNFPPHITCQPILGTPRTPLFVPTLSDLLRSSATCAGENGALATFGFLRDTVRTGRGKTQTHSLRLSRTRTFCWRYAMVQTRGVPARGALLVSWVC